MMTKFRKSLIYRCLSTFIGISILTTTFITAALPVTDIPVYADADKAIVLVNSGVASNIGNPTNGAGNWSKVFFGNYYQSNNTATEPVQWRVLSPVLRSSRRNTEMLIK